MNQGIRTVSYPVKDLARAKMLYSKLLGIEPYLDGLALELGTKK